MNLFLLLFLAACFFLFLIFPMFKTPSSMAAMLVIISGALVSMMSVCSSFWFSYILFLVYIGGLLVLFIYVCLVSSNYPFQLDLVPVICALLASLFMSFFSDYASMKASMGGSGYEAGSSLVVDSNVSLFVSLVILLLVMLLVIVRSTGSGAVMVSEKS